MSIHKKSDNCVISVQEMAELLKLSRSRFYDLMRTGIFPRPVRIPSSNRPIFDQELQQRCLEIRRTGVGYNGQPVLFNRRRKAKANKRRQANMDATGEHSELVETLGSLGLTANKEAVQNAFAANFPEGTDHFDKGEVIRRLFLYLQDKGDK